MGIGLLPFTFAGLVIASVFYSLPFVVQPLQQAFEALGEATLEAAATLQPSEYAEKNAETIRAADRNPENYPDLVVRVTGFSVYFSSLSPEFRRIVVDRIVSEHASVQAS